MVKGLIKSDHLQLEVTLFFLMFFIFYKQIIDIQTL